MATEAIGEGVGSSADERMDRRLLEKYHCALVRSHQEKLEQLKARIGASWAEEMKDKVGGLPDAEDFSRALEEYLLGELCLCGSADAKVTADEVSVDIRGCHICHANEELRREGRKAMCPVIPAVMQSISKVHGRKAELEGVEKTGTVGECTIRYRLK